MAINKNNATYVRTSSGALIPTSSISPQALHSPVPPAALNANNIKTDSQFELNSDYIQQTIQSALDRNDLSPDVEEKLVHLKNYSNDPSSPAATPLSPPNQRPVNNKRQRDASEASESRLGKSSVKRSRNASSDTRGSPSRQRAGDGERKVKRSSGHGMSAASSDDTKKKHSALAKLENQLSKHKDLLKKDILKKRPSNFPGIFAKKI